MKKVLVTIITIALFLISANARKSRIENRVERMKVALFVPCYVNALYPEVGKASYRLLTSLGLEVDYPLEQTCCGQPMANAGYEADAKPLAEKMRSWKNTARSTKGL